MKTVFKAESFTPTKFDTAEDKAKFANHFVRFVESDFNQNLFQKWFYKRLSMTFGHIAHYDQHGFWAEFFTNDTDKLRFMDQTMAFPCYGQPEYTYCDVERALITYFRQGHDPRLELKGRISATLERSERAELERLSKKYGTPPDVSPKA